VNKRQLIETLSSRFDGDKRQAKNALEAVVETITREVSKGEKVAITGFGAFEKVDRPARMVRNPATGERIRAKKTSVPRFRPGAELKAFVAGDKKMPKATAAAAKAASSTTGRKMAASKTTSSASARKTAAGKATSSTSGRKSTAGRKSAASKSTTSKASASKSTASPTSGRKATTAKRASAKKS
jgi:DNA-binding protein HU-beta